MVQSPNPFILKNVSVTLVRSSTVASGGTPVEFRCQLTQAQLTPSASSAGGNSLDTFCESYSDSGTSSTWVLELAGFQAFKDINDFSILSFQHEGEEVDFTLTPILRADAPISATNPSFTGVAKLVATPIGGTAKQYAVFTASLPVTGKPVMVITP